MLVWIDFNDIVPAVLGFAGKMRAVKKNRCDGVCFQLSDDWTVQDSARLVRTCQHDAPVFQLDSGDLVQVRHTDIDPATGKVVGFPGIWIVNNRNIGADLSPAFVG